MWTRTKKMSNVVTIINVTSFQTCHPPSTESSAESTIQSLKQQPSLRVFLQFFSTCFFSYYLQVCVSFFTFLYSFYGIFRAKHLYTTEYNWNDRGVIIEQSFVVCLKKTIFNKRAMLNILWHFLYTTRYVRLLCRLLKKVKQNVLQQKPEWSELKF